jgi:hypothetical protein
MGHTPQQCQLQIIIHPDTGARKAGWPLLPIDFKSYVMILFTGVNFLQAKRSIIE